LMLLLPAFRFVSSFLLTRLTQRAQFELSLTLCRRFLSLPLRSFEQVGSARLLATLTDDVNTIIGSFTNVPLLLMHASVVLGCLVYLAWLSWQVLLVILGFMALGVASYRLPMLRAQRHFRSARESWDQLLKHYRGLVDGIKELKLNAGRREAFVAERLEVSARDRMRHMVSGATTYAAAESWGQTIAFLALGLLVFVVPEFLPAQAATLSGFALATLYMLTPLEVLMSQLPGLARGAVAVQRVEALGITLAALPAEKAVAPLRGGELPWQSLELRAVRHSYFREGEEERFTLGPIDLVVHPGELVFIVGGNGSGKTTLAKILVGLYRPEDGEILLDGQPLAEEDLDRFRQLFATVFSDFFLFDRLLGLEGRDLDARAAHYLEVLRLERKVDVRDGSLSTIDLSTGQRKRLALLTAYLEDRPIYLFDEWAADQDPSFKALFYRELLPELRSRGKTVLVISHDDHYYDVADRLIKLSEGRIESDERVAKLSASSVGMAH
jgi:putative pyoverdin transport system ATP-binding/permease protein